MPWPQYPNANIPNALWYLNQIIQKADQAIPQASATDLPLWQSVKANAVLCKGNQSHGCHGDYIYDPPNQVDLDIALNEHVILAYNHVNANPPQLQLALGAIDHSGGGGGNGNAGPGGNTGDAGADQEWAIRRLSGVLHILDDRRIRALILKLLKRAVKKVKPKPPPP